MKLVGGGGSLPPPEKADSGYFPSLRPSHTQSVPGPTFLFKRRVVDRACILKSPLAWARPGSYW